MQARRVLLLTNRSLLAAGVQRLLQGVEDIALSVVSAETDGWTAQAKLLHPQVILLDSGDDSLGTQIIARLLEEHPQAKIVALNLNRHDIEVFRRTRATQPDLDGLLQAIGATRPVKGKDWKQLKQKGEEG